MYRRRKCKEVFTQRASYRIRSIGRLVALTRSFITTRTHTVLVIRVPTLNDLYRLFTGVMSKVGSLLSTGSFVGRALRKLFPKLTTSETVLLPLKRDDGSFD